MFKDVFGFAEQQDKATYRLCCQLLLTKNKSDAVIDKAAATADARIKIDHIHWYVGHYFPSIQQQGLLSKQVLSKSTTELRYVEWSVFMKEANNQSYGNLTSDRKKKWIILYG